MSAFVVVAVTVWHRIQAYPVRAQAVVVAGVALASAFGLGWTAEQTAAVTAFTATLLAFVTEKYTTPYGDKDLTL